MMTDPIADMLTRIRNGIQVRRKSVDLPTSRVKSLIALTMKEEGYLADKGLSPLPEDDRSDVQQSAAALAPLEL